MPVDVNCLSFSCAIQAVHNGSGAAYAVYKVLPFSQFSWYWSFNNNKSQKHKLKTV